MSSDAAPAVPSEQALAVLWQRAHSLPDGLLTQDGRRLRVVYPGRPGRRAGPDFRDAVLVTESGDRISGDVELHLSAPDWYGHGHDSDSNYNGVVLHVVLRPRHSTSSERQSGMEKPVASLAPVLDLLDSQEADVPVPALTPEPRGPEEWGEALDRAGNRRFLARSRAFALEMANASPDQVLYSALMEALGYASNRRAMRELAGRVPVASLMALRGEPEGTRVLAMKAMLVGASGLLGRVNPEEARVLRRLRRRLPRTRPMPSTRWELFRVRPGNHPLKRISGAAHLVNRYAGAGLTSGIEPSLWEGPRAIVASLTARPLVGQSRAADMAVNVVLPFYHACAGMRRAQSLRLRCLELYRQFPRLQENEITREMSRLLGPDCAGVVTSARRQQGLVHIYKNLPRHLPA